MESLERPALGADPSIGIFYDARRDIFLPGTIFEIESFRENASDVAWEQKRTLKLCDSDTTQAKFRAAGVPSSLAASCLAGWVTYQGSSQHLAIPDRTGSDQIYHALHLTTTTVRQQLHLDLGNLGQEVQTCHPTATHVVTHILWGASFSLVATGSVSNEDKRAELSLAFAEATRRVNKFGFEIMDLITLFKKVDEMADPCLILHAYSDLLPAMDRSLTNLTQIKQHLEQIFDLADTGYNIAKPISYGLSPIHFGTEKSPVQVIGQLQEVQLQTIMGIMDTFRQVHAALDGHYRRLKQNRSFVPAEELVDCQTAIEDITGAESTFRSRFSSELTLLRAGETDHTTIQGLIDDFIFGPSSPNQFMAATTKSSAKMDLLASLTAKGAICINHGSLPKFLPTARFVLYFSAVAIQDPSWPANSDLITQILSSQSTKESVFAVDCDTGGPPLTKPRVAVFKNGNLTTFDVVEMKEHEAALSFINFDPNSVDPHMKDAPSQHKSVKIPCPGEECGGERRDWICKKCRVKVEFGVVDSFLYCDCGRAHVNSASFNCQQNHGQIYTRFSPRRLQQLLEELPTPPEINVLILGETGVGKSTFINSFINYLNHQQLDDALAAKNLDWIIPCSFSTQSEGQGGRLVQTQVQIGKSDKDEHDGTRGQSATQDATVYSVYFGGGMIRLIDTPGIGDTRGKDQDEQNLIKILRVLRNYDKIHGILILLKPNNARLNIMFKFCVKELLTQLHRSAAQNIVFGFTNTRGSNYQPGDTFQPLETLLKDYEDVIPGLFKDTVYCFDSESFRYLAARYKGVDMGHIDDYRRSWDMSAKEARRMVAYFQSRPPHEVKSTVSLNETRYLISQLIGPMAMITNAIADTVQNSEEQIKDLEKTELSGKQLAAKLTMTKTIIESKPLDRPRTVCSNNKCCTHTSDESNGGSRITLFKSRCHDPCYLTDVPPDEPGAKELPPCAAFNGQQECQICGHHWREHQHIVVEYSERTVKTTDPGVQNALNQNSDAASAKKMQINALKRLIKELQEEHRMIQESQARFSHYLEQHSITGGWNDATIEYYEHLIKDEKSKVSRGANRTRLDQMEKDKATYEYFVNVMKKGKNNSIGSPLNEDGVYVLVKKLYAMKHYGHNLRDCASKTGQAYSATFRERAYRVRRGHNGGVHHDLFHHDHQESQTRKMAAVMVKDLSNPFKGLFGWGSMGSSRESRSQPESSQSKLMKRKTIKKFIDAAEYQEKAEASISQNNEISSIFDDSYFDEKKQDDSGPMRAMEVQQSSTFQGVKSRLLEDEEDPPSYEDQGGQISKAAVQTAFLPHSPSGASMKDYGPPVPVFFDTGNPVQRSRTKSKLFSNLKDKLKGHRK